MSQSVIVFRPRLQLKLVDGVSWRQVRTRLPFGCFIELNTRSERGARPSAAAPQRNVSSYNELRNTNISCFSRSVSSRNRRDTCSASPLCRSMAFSSVKERRSCMYRGLMRRPQSAAVRNLSAVSCGGFCTIPSPVPTSCSKKSLKG